MANMTVSDKFTQNIDISKLSTSVNLQTANKYVDRDINLSLNVSHITLAKGQTFQLTHPTGDNTSVTWTFVIDANGNATIK